MSSQGSNQTDASSALVPAIILFGGLTLLLLGLLASRPTPESQPAGSSVSTMTVAETTNVPEPQVVAMAIDPVKVKAGENTFQSTCSACHGFNAMGIPGLGKTLIGSDFVNGLTDDELLVFLETGREVTDPLNTTGVMMPARGGNPSITDDKLVEVIAYIRSLNTVSSEIASVPTAAPTIDPSVPTNVPKPFAPPDVSGLSVPTSEADTATTSSSELAITGESLYVQSCSGCHGVDGSGVAYIAGSLSSSQLLLDKNGIGLLNFLIKAEPPVNPTERFPHPSRGGYPQLSDADIQSIIGYLYGLPAVN